MIVGTFRSLFMRIFVISQAAEKIPGTADDV